MNEPQQLRELELIIRNFGNKSTKSLFLPNKKNTQLRLLARKISTRAEVDERKWAKEICGTFESDQTYIRLRSQLKRRMFGYFFHFDIRTGAEIRKAVYRSAQDVFFIRMLIIFGARKVAIMHIPRALERARKYELTRDRIELLLLLRSNATLNGDGTKFAHYARELNEVESIWTAEMRMQAMNEEIGVELAVRVNPNEKVKVLAKLAYPEAAMLFKLHPTFNIGLNYFRIATLASQIAEDSKQTFDRCTQAELFLSRFSHLVSPLHIGQFAITRMNSAFSVGNFDAALSAKSTCEASFPKGQNNWFIWKEIEFLIYMHINRFTEAMAIHKEIVSHDRFPSQTEQVREKWALLGHYAALAAGREKSSISSATRKAFAKILREVPIYTRDKAGYNAALLILQQLIFAFTGNLDGMIVKSDALKRYIERHLRGRHETHLYAFIKSLLILQKYDFDLEKVQKRTKKYVEQFKRNDHKKIDETQTLRYDYMWAWILEGVELGLKLREEVELSAIGTEPQNGIVRHRSKQTSHIMAKKTKTAKQTPSAGMNPKADFYFRKAKKWKQALERLRTIVLKTPLTEEVKWGVPCYTYDDHNVVLIHDFKDYCALLFVKGALLSDPDGILIQQTKHVQSGRQIRFTNLPEIIEMESLVKGYIHEAIEVEKAGLKVKKKETSEYPVPEEFQHKLNTIPSFKKAFYALTPGRQRGYLFYFSQPKLSKTRESRVEKYIPHIMAGKGFDDE
jgi:uncharacterized protein YdeI (YjbR/CyaY-like superfamily)